MKQHPVPQHIASYQFRLIGQMTLKQFLELAAGIVAGWLIYSLNIAPIVKLPLAFTAGCIGIALAFLPFEERTLDRWFINFMRAVYSPTQYVWRKSPQIPEILSQKTTIVFKKAAPMNAPKDELSLKEYLATIPSPATASPLEADHLNHLAKIASLLGSNQNINLFEPPSTPFVPTAKADNIIKPTVSAAPPLTPPILVESSIPYKLDPIIAAQFSTTLPIPTTPTVPNLVVGMVLNEMGKIVTNALIEIIDSRGETVRALKSNRLGQFFCASPLAAGDYKLKVEHPEYVFTTMELKAENKIIPPIKINAQKHKEVTN